MRAGEGERAQKKSDEEAAGVSQKNGRGIEVVAQEAEDGACERDGHHGDEGISGQQCDDESDQRGEQGGAGRQAIKAIDEIEGIGDGENPQNRERQPDEPGQLMFAKQHRNIDECADHR